MLLDWIGIGIGGVLGSLLRFFTTSFINRFWHYSFPIATFSINLTGSFALAILYLLDHGSDKLFILDTLGIGFLGAFTTFSTFTYETAILMDRRAFAAAFSYLVLSVALGISGAWVAHLVI